MSTRQVSMIVNWHLDDDDDRTADDLAASLQDYLRGELESVDVIPA